VFTHPCGQGGDQSDPLLSPPSRVFQAAPESVKGRIEKDLFDACGAPQFSPVAALVFQFVPPVKQYLMLTWRFLFGFRGFGVFHD
jgi:hypothetical protein